MREHVDYQDYHYYHVGVLSIRIKTVSKDIKERIVTMGCLFVLEGIVKPYIMAIDSTLLSRLVGKYGTNHPYG
jgi:hypothetical protein